MKSTEEQLELVQIALLILRNGYQQDDDLEASAVLSELLRQLEDFKKGRLQY